MDSFKVSHCPICGRTLSENWMAKHIKLAHPDTLTDAEKEAIINSVVERGYYDYSQFQHEQHEED